MWGKQDPVHASRLAEQGLSFAPPAAWIVERAIPEAPADTQGSVQFPLSDTQIDLTNGRDWSFRIVQRALNSDGVGRIANFSISFDPSYERATVHRVRVLRGAEIIDLADPEAFQLLRRETNLERRLYDGRLTADMQIPDLRPGDLLDTWFTTHGFNPAIRNAMNARFSFEWSDPVAMTALRIRAPESRKFSIRTLPDTWKSPSCSETQPADGVIDREWIDTRAGVFRYDDATPDWWHGHGRVDVADTCTWSDIADLFREAYAPPAELPAGIRAEIDRIAAAFPAAPDRVIEALRYVQREIRYLSVSFGEGGHVPRPVDEIWSRRFGDCKDVSRLLSAMLGALGVDATPALVNTRAGEVLHEQLPGVHAFDHCIVRARLNGASYWLDGTFAEQGGDLDHLFQSRLGWALPLEAGTKLEKATPENPLIHVLEQNESFVFGPRPDSPAELRIEGIYRGWRADSMRSSLRRDGVDRHSEMWLKQYTKYYNGAVELDPPRIVDDLKNNVITLTERYRLERPWDVATQVARFNSMDDVFQPDLAVLPYPGRTQPLHISVPRRITRRTTFRLPMTWPISPWSDVISAPGIRGKTEFRISEAGKMQLDVDYEITAPQVSGPDLEAFRQAIEKLRGGVSVVLTHAIKNGEFVKNKQNNYSGNTGAGIALGLVLLIAAIRFIMSMNG